MAKIACILLVAVASIWFSLSFRGNKVFFKVGYFEHQLISFNEAIDDSEDGEASESDFA